MFGKPFGPGARLIESRVISRPLTAMLLLLATTKRSSRPKKSDRWKKLPVKVKLNGSIGKPAGPTLTPGGSVWGAAAAVTEPLEPLVEPLPELGAGAGAGLLLPVRVRELNCTCDFEAA